MPSNQNYKNYGGRGITVCDEWRNNFQAFYDWAMANGYDEKAPRGQCMLDRIDNDGVYSPGNCRWATAKEQSNNKRNNRLHNGEKEVILTSKEMYLITIIRQNVDPAKVLQIAIDRVEEGTSNGF